MKTVFTMFGVLLALGLLGAALYACYLAAGYLWAYYADLDAVVRLLLLSAMAALLFGCMLVAAAIKRAAQISVHGRLQEARFALYKSVVDAYRQCTDTAHQPAQSELFDGLNRLEAELTILASGAVIEAQRKLRSAFENHETEAVEPLFHQLVKCIRRDLGHGSGYDESRLKFFLSYERRAPAGSEVQGVSG